jgi:hypothetical protein
MTVTQTIAPGYAGMPRSGSDAHAAVWPTRVIVFTPIVVATVFAKFAPWSALVPAIGLLFPVILLALGIGLLTGRLQLVPARLALLLLMLSVLSLVQVWRGDMFSLGSLAMMALLGLAYTPAARPHTVSHEDAMRFFCNLSVIISIAGILQFGLQFIGGTALAFPIETYVPEAFRTRGYNDMAVLYYGSHIYKATGFVMLEPSVFCQLCALGLTCELVYKSRVWRMVVYAAAIVVSYSGTGLLILAVTLPLLVILHRRWDLLIRGLLLAGILALLVEPLNLNVTMNRATEFSSSGSSAFIRFVGWVELFNDKLWTEPARALLGYGAGSFFDAAAGYRAGEMAHAKIVFEFGVIGALFYFAFIFYCLLGSRAPIVLRIGIIVAYFMNGAYSPSVTGFATSLLLWPTTAAMTPLRRTVIQGREASDAR